MIDTKALRKKVLELALSGQLSSVGDKENSKDLIKCIVQEKERLVKDKVISKIKPLAPIRDDEKLFSIPNNWEYVKLGTLSLPLSDGVHYAPEYQTEGYKCFSAKDIYNNRINDDNCTFITEEEYLGMKGKINVREGSILITKSGSIGRSTVVKEYYEFGLVESIGVINPIIVNSEYIKYVLDYGFVYSSYYLDKYTRGVGLKHLTLTLLENIPIPVPSLEEQDCIVRLLNSTFGLLDAIDSYQEKYSNDLAVLKSKIIDAGIRGKLTEQLPEDGDAEDLYAQILNQKSQLIKEGKIKKEKQLLDIAADEIPFEIPKNWKWVRIGNVINEVIVPQRDKPTFSGNIPWCRIEDRDGIFLNGTKSGQYVSEETVKAMNLRIFPVGTVLSACSGASIGTILITTVECCTNQTFNGLVCNDRLHNWFLFWHLKSEINRLKKLGSGSAMAYVSQDKIRNMLMPLPPYEEQLRITKRIDEINSIIERVG